MDLARRIDAYLRSVAVKVIGDPPSEDRPTVTVVQLVDLPTIRVAHATNSLPGMQFGLVVYQTGGMREIAEVVWGNISQLVMGDPLVEYVLFWIDYDGDGKTKFLIRTPALGGFGFSQGNDATIQALQFLANLLSDVQADHPVITGS